MNIISQKRGNRIREPPNNAVMTLLYTHTHINLEDKDIFHIIDLFQQREIMITQRGSSRLHKINNKEAAAQVHCMIRTDNTRNIRM